jgi:hypothetical protein
MMKRFRPHLHQLVTMLLLALAASGCGKPALVEDTRVLGQMVYFAKHGEPVRNRTQTLTYLSKTFEYAGEPEYRGINYREDQGAIWAVLHIVAEATSNDGELLLAANLEGMKINAADAFVRLKTEQMGTPTADWLQADKPGYVGRMTRIGMRLSPADSALLEQPERLRRIVTSKRYPLFVDNDNRGQPLGFNLDLESQRGLRPIFVEVIVGQGAYPRELQAYAAQSRPLWYVRYAPAIGFFLVLVVIGIGVKILFARHNPS